MFYWDQGLRLTRADLAIDATRRQPRAFISHAHADHMAPHQFALCTPQTALLYRHLHGRREVREMPYREPISWGGLRLTTYPAGHCLGSAMLLAEDDRQRLLYSGDFKLTESATAERAELPPADIFIIESTFGHPKYRFPPRGEVIEQLVDLVRHTLAAARPPVIRAYRIGKAQEVTRILTQAGIPVLQHPMIYGVSQIYQQCGVELGACSAYTGRWQEGHAVVAPPARQRAAGLAGLEHRVEIALTGWAIDAATKQRWNVDHVVPLSDHADFDALIEAVATVNPREVYCTHGPDGFDAHLRDAGFNAFPLAEQRRLR